MATRLHRPVMSQVLVTPMVWAISRLAAPGFSSTSSAPSPVKRTRYRFPFRSPAMVYRVEMI